MKKYKLYILICPEKNIVRYVGITSKLLKKRLQEHINHKRNRHKYNWIQKLKKQNLKPQIKLVADKLSKEKACQMEIDLISLYRSLVGKKLTNLTDGGEGFNGTHNEITKRKLSIPIIQYNKDGEKIQKFYSSVEAQKITKISSSQITSCCRGRLKTAGGYIWRYEGDDFSKFGWEKDSSKKVCQFSKQGKKIATFQSLWEASQITGVAESSISLCCQKKRLKTAGGYVWRYKGEKFTNPIKNTNKDKRIKILQIDFKSKKIIKEHESIKAAGNLFKNPNARIGIGACCRGNQKTAYGFIWKYKD